MPQRSVRLAVAAATALTMLAAATVAAGLVTTSSGGPAARGGIASEERINHQVFRGGESLSKFEQEASARAYPAAEVPLAATLNAQATWERIVRQSRSPRVTGTPNVWELFGAKQRAFWPGPLQPTGGPYVASGRTTAMVISPTCTVSSCHLLIGAAGGGIWKTDNPLDAVPTWSFVSGDFDTNAIGTLRVDPNNPLVVYAGTGEPNASGDSEAGTGIWRSADGGSTWTRLAGAQSGGPACAAPDLTVCAVGESAFLGRSIGEIAIQPGNPLHVLATTTRGVRGVSSVGGAVSQNSSYPPVGLWESVDAGQTFSYVWNANLSVRGAVDVEFGPITSSDVYVSAFQQGVWRRSPGLDGNSSFNQIFAPLAPAFNTDRTMFDLVAKNGQTRVYLVSGASGTPPASFWRTDNADQPSAMLLATQAAGSTAPAGNGNPYPAVYNGWQKLTSTSTASPYWATNDYCTAQCVYDNDVHSPPGRPDDVYVIGSYLYGEVPCVTRGWICGSGVSNGRAVLYSSTAGDPDPANLNRTFTDFTLDAQNTASTGCEHPLSTCIWAPHSIHPDQHEVVVNPNNPSQIFEASDGGVIRTSGMYANLSRTCLFRPGLTGSDLTACLRVTSRASSELQQMNEGLSTLQFQSLSYNPFSPCNIQAGTQDNGTWEAKGCNENEFTEIIDGDGGQSGWDHGNPSNRFNQFFAGFGSVNFTNGDPTERHWYFSTGPILNSPEGGSALFYWPQIADPIVGGTMYTGFRHVWRTFDWAGGLASLSDPAKNCQVVTATGGEPDCGDWIPMGGPAGASTAGDLGGTVYGADRAGGSVSQVQRSRADTGTIWAATSLGRLFVSSNARCGTAVDASCVVWARVDSLAANDPGRFVTGIYPDPANPNRAWVSYNGYNLTTPATPGHVFEVNVAPGGGSASFTDLQVEAGLSSFPAPPLTGDLPVSDVVRDDATGQLYASSDFGVLRGTGAPGQWTIAGSGLPRVEVSSLNIVPGRDNCLANCGRVLFAATHGRSIWVLRLP